MLAKIQMQHWKRERERIEPAIDLPFRVAINLDLSSSVPTQCHRNCIGD